MATKLKRADGDKSSLRLGKQLWDKLETAQGYSFVSDDMIEWPDGMVLEFVERNLTNVRKVTQVFEKMNEKYKFVPEK